MEIIELTLGDKIKVSRRYLFDGLKEMYASMISDRLDVFFISRAGSHVESYKTRGNVVQRVNGVFTDGHYDKLCAEGVSGIALMQAELQGQQ